MTSEQYLYYSTKYFAPLDEILEALENNEGIAGLSHEELLQVIMSNNSLSSDLDTFAELTNRD